MGFRIIIAGEAQCNAYAETVLLADYLSQQLPNFSYTCIQKTVYDWKPNDCYTYATGNTATAMHAEGSFVYRRVPRGLADGLPGGPTAGNTWLCKLNMKNKWHHMESPIVWKELLMKGSKPHYIGGASEFLDYCYSYYNFDGLFASDKYDGLLDNILQFKRKVRAEKLLLDAVGDKTPATFPKKHFVVTISGACHSLAMHLISGLLNPRYTRGEKVIRKIYLYDECCSKTFMNYIEKQCSYIQTDNPGRVVRFVDKIGIALTSTDMLIVLDHEPFDEKKSIGEWLRENRKKMKILAYMINASGPYNLKILFANLGPACYNATFLRSHVNTDRSNIAVATSGLGMEILPIVSKIAEVPLRNMFCPPVWGFVGINHLVDIRTTVHIYNSFEPYTRFSRVKNSTLNIGSITPEMRTLYYLMHFDDTLWIKVAEMKKMFGRGPEAEARLIKSNAVISLVNMWLLDPTPENIVCLGISCNGSFGLNFDGIFSQPARFVNGHWEPATDFLMPLDREMKLFYLEKIAEYIMQIEPNGLPPIEPYYPCSCKPRLYTL